MVVTGNQPNNLFKNALLKTEVINKTGLIKMACCNLSESFENSATVTVGFTDAISGAGLSVTFTSSNIDYALITGDFLTVSAGAIVGNDDGVCVLITASQAGNDEYNAAPSVSHILRVIHDAH